PAQVRGFGFLHDGSTDTLVRFHNATVFNGGFTAGNCGTDPDTCRRNVEQFMLAFDTNLAPIVGQQITLTSSNSGTVLPQILLLRKRAAAAECDVVVKGNIGGLQRGWVCTGTNCCSGTNCSGASTFLSDRAGETETAASLAAKASVTGQELTYTAVPPGSGTRIGIDRDLDGFLDRTETETGPDPADPTSFPGATTTTTASTTTTTGSTPPTTGSTTTTTGSTTSTTSTTIPSGGPSKCTGKKFLVAGKKVRSRATCYAKAV